MNNFRKIIVYWICATLLLCAGFVLYSETLPRDELVMANTFSFKILLSLIVVGVPSIFSLFLVLFFGPILRGTRL